MSFLRVHPVVPPPGYQPGSAITPDLYEDDQLYELSELGKFGELR